MEETFSSAAFSEAFSMKKREKMTCSSTIRVLFTVVFSIMILPMLDMVAFAYKMYWPRTVTIVGSWTELMMTLSIVVPETLRMLMLVSWRGMAVGEESPKNETTENWDPSSDSHKTFEIIEDEIVRFLLLLLLLLLLLIVFRTFPLNTEMPMNVREEPA